MVGEIGNWPHRRRLSQADWRGGAVIGAVVVGVWIYIGFFASDDAPKWMPYLAGCYALDGKRDGIKLTVEKDGMIKSGTLVTTSTSEEDKAAVYLLPLREVLYDEHSDKLIFGSGYPLEFRLDHNRRSFDILTSNREGSVSMVRMPDRVCAAANR